MIVSAAASPFAGLAACSQKAQNETAEAADTMAADANATMGEAVNDIDAATDSALGAAGNSMDAAGDKIDNAAAIGNGTDAAQRQDRTRRSSDAGNDGR